MISYLLQLSLVVKYETKMVLRSWPFRILCFLGISTTLMQVVGMLGSIYTGVATFIGPMFTAANTTIIGLAQIGAMLTFTVVFFANDMGSRDRSIGIGDVVSARPFSTSQYVLGRIFSLLLPLTCLMMAALGLSLLANYAFGFRIAPLAQYGPFFLGFSVLGVAYTASMTAFFSTLIRTRLLASLAALIPTLASTTYLLSISGAFDLSGQIMSQQYSALIGWASMDQLISWRLCYLCLTLFFMSAAVLCYPKPEAERRRPIALLFSAVLLSVSAGLIYQQVTDELRNRRQLQLGREAMIAAASNTAASVEHYDMDVHLLPEGGYGRLRATVATTLKNRGDTEQDTFVFVLNPGLKIGGVSTAGGFPVDVVRRVSVVHLTLDAPLMPEETVELIWEYEGEIDPRAAWIARDRIADSFEEEFAELRIGASLGEMSGWVGDRFCFLLPESHWYPIPNVPIGHIYPDKRPANFATARIGLSLPPGWTGVTQGILREEQVDEGRRMLVFETDMPVPQFSLCAGEYEKVTTQIDGIEIALLYAPVHSENIDFFAEAVEEIKAMIGRSMEGIADATGLTYPYASLSVVEVPSMCRRFSDSWDRRNLLVQPGVLLLSESDFFNEYFAFSFSQAEKRSKREGTGATSAQIKAELLRGYFRGDGYGGDLELNLLPNYWEFQVDPSGTAYPALGSAFTAVLADTALGRHQRSAMDYEPSLSIDVDGGSEGFEMNVTSNDRRKGFGGTDFDPGELLMPLAAITPSAQKGHFEALLNRRTNGLVKSLELVLGKEKWENFVPELLERHQFQSISLEDLQRRVGGYTDEDVSWVFDQLVHKPVMPGYMFTYASAYEIDMGQRERLFQLTVRIANLEEGKGFARLSVTTEGLGDSDTVEETYFFDDREEKEIRMVLRDKPVSVRLLSAASRNTHIPEETIFVPEERRAIPGEESVRTIPEDERGLVITVDDLDEGFSTINLRPEERIRLLRHLETAQSPGGATKYPVLLGRYGGPRAPRVWNEQTWREAFGKYSRTRKIKGAGDGSQFAVWSASLPRDGTYEVLFYINLAPWQTRGRYLITVENGDYGQDVDFRLAAVDAGWNSLGKFKFRKDGLAQVKLSDEIPNSNRYTRLYADAVRWVYQESSGSPAKR